MNPAPRPFGRGAAALALGPLVLALAVAGAIKRPPPDFLKLPVVAVLRDAQQRAAWTIRLSGEAHEIAAEGLHPEPPPRERAYQLWFANGNEPLQIGLLPPAGETVIPVSPTLTARLGGSGRLIVTLEPARGSPKAVPTGPEVFGGILEPSR